MDDSQYLLSDYRHHQVLCTIPKAGVPTEWGLREQKIVFMEDLAGMTQFSNWRARSTSKPRMEVAGK